MPQSAKPAPEQPTRTPRRSRAALREATLRVARDIIASEGPEALTARRLAREVGYTPGTIYNLFDSLPDVLWQVNRAHFQSIATLFDDLPGDGPAPRLRALAARYLALVRSEPALFRALFEGPRQSDSFPQWYTDAIGGLIELIAAELHALNPALSADAARQEAVALFGAVQGFATLHVSDRLEMITPVSAADLADGLIGRVLRDIGAAR